MTQQNLVIEPEDLDKIFHRWKYRDRLDERKYYLVIEPEDLDKIFHRWKYRDRLDERKYPMCYQKTYRDQRFEDWLWDHGGSVVQKNGKRYLVFSEYDRGIEFKLTTLYGV